MLAVLAESACLSTFRQERALIQNPSLARAQVVLGDRLGRCLAPALMVRWPPPSHLAAGPTHIVAWRCQAGLAMTS